MVSYEVHGRRWWRALFYGPSVISITRVFTLTLSHGLATHDLHLNLRLCRKRLAELSDIRIQT